MTTGCGDTTQGEVVLLPQPLWVVSPKPVVIYPHVNAVVRQVQ